MMERENHRLKDEVEDLRAELIHEEKRKIEVMEKSVDGCQLDNLKNILNC